MPTTVPTMKIDDLVSRIHVLEQSHQDLKQTTNSHIARLDRMIEEIRSTLTSMGEKVDERLAELRDSIQTLTTEALQSMPAWAMHASERKSSMINILTAITAALLAGSIAMGIALYHH